MIEFVDLEYGSSGSNVTLLQQLLRINGYFPASITGVYGPDTSTYVSLYQKENNLVVTGNVDEETWKSLFLITQPAVGISILDKPVLKIDDTGEDVVEVQTILKSLGYYKGVINGIFDSVLEVSLQAFQFTNKIVPSGVVNETTWSALLFLYAPLADCDEGVENLDVYIVNAGDTLYSIARKFDISVSELKTLNNLDSDTLSIGQELIVSSNPDVNLSEEYIVKLGDTLYSIASDFGVSVVDLRLLNNLTSDLLSIGQILKIPSSDVIPLPDNIYVVKTGDTLYSIARELGISVSELKALNNLDSDILSVGQELIIPGKEEVLETSYIVQAGDTLYNIASRYGVSVNDILALNNLSSALLTIGQALKIPSFDDDEITYTVQPGDTLYGIARKFNTTVDSILVKNNLNSALLSIGQVLKI